MLFCWRDMKMKKRLLLVCCIALVAASRAERIDGHAAEQQVPSEMKESSGAGLPFSDIFLSPEQGHGSQKSPNHPDDSLPSSKPPKSKIWFEDWSVIIAGIATAVSIVSAWFSILSGRAGRDSANTAKRSLDHAQEITAMQLRGYLYLTGLRKKRMTLDFDKNNPDPLVVKIANYGSTPVEITGMVAELIEEQGHTERRVIPDIPDRIIPAGKLVEIEFKMPPVQSAGIRARKAGFGIYISVSYVDLFQQRRRTKELYEFDQQAHNFHLKTNAEKRSRT